MTNTTPCKNKTRTWKNKSVYDIDMNQISLDNAAVIVLEHIKVYGFKKIETKETENNNNKYLGDERANLCLQIVERRYFSITRVFPYYFIYWLIDWFTYLFIYLFTYLFIYFLFLFAVINFKSSTSSVISVGFDSSYVSNHYIYYFSVSCRDPEFFSYLKMNVTEWEWNALSTNQTHHRHILVKRITYQNEIKTHTCVVLSNRKTYSKARWNSIKKPTTYVTPNKGSRATMLLRPFL